MKNKILIIEDDVDTRKGLSVRLRASGYETSMAADGVTAISMATQERPQLILLDIGLPGGDGFVVLERLRNLPALSGTPVIVISGRVGYWREKALNAGAAAFLSKPIDNKELLAAIARNLGGGAARAEGPAEARKKILCVEDDADTRRALDIRLKAAGYGVVLAGDSVTALAAAKKEKPDLVILDLGLPGGDGFVFMERLRKNLPLERTPIIILSARDPGAYKQRALAAGAAAYFRKPPENEAFLAAIRDALEGAS